MWGKSQASSRGHHVLGIFWGMREIHLSILSGLDVPACHHGLLPPIPSSPPAIGWEMCS